MRLVVTGTTGFLGQHLVSWLDHRSISFARIDRRTGWPTTVEQWSERFVGTDVVIHLAGIAHTGAADEKFLPLIDTMRDMIAAAQNVGIRQFIYMSSIVAQSDAVSDDVIDETSDPQPVNAYGKTKLECEKLLIASGVPYTILRPVVIFGPGAKGNSGLLQRLASSNIPLPLIGIEGRRAIVSAAQVNEAIGVVLLNSAAINQIYVVADDAMTIGEIVARLRRQASLPPRLFRVPQVFLTLLFGVLGKREAWRRMSQSLVVDSSKLRSLGWLRQRNEDI